MGIGMLDFVGDNKPLIKPENAPIELGVLLLRILNTYVVYIKIYCSINEKKYIANLHTPVSP